MNKSLYLRQWRQVRQIAGHLQLKLLQLTVFLNIKFWVFYLLKLENVKVLYLTALDTTYYAY